MIFIIETDDFSPEDSECYVAKIRTGF